MSYNVRRIEVGVYKDALWLVWPVNAEQAKEFLVKKGVRDPAHVLDIEDSDGLSVRCKIGSVIFLPEWRITLHHLGVLLHEVCHAASDILYAHQIKEAENSEEALAYLMEFLFTGCLKKLGCKNLSKVR